MNIKEDYYKVELPRNWVLLCLDTTDMNPRYVRRIARRGKRDKHGLRPRLRSLRNATRNLGRVVSPVSNSSG